MGRQLLRPARGIWQSPGIDCVSVAPDGPHQALALGAIVAAAGGGPTDAAALSSHHLMAAVTSAGVRLLGLDPMDLAVVQERVGHQADALTRQALTWAEQDPADLPAWGGTLTEILGERHGTLDARMFVA